MQDIAIIGIGETPAVRRSDRSLWQLAVDSVEDAIADAGLEASDIDGIVTDSIIMPGSIPHDWMAGQLGIQRGWDGSLSYGGAGTVGAPLVARPALQQGLARYVLCYFAVDWGSKPGGPYAFHDIYPSKRAFEKPYGFNAQPAYFAMIANRYAHEYGLEPEHLAAVALSSRANSIRTGRGQAMTPLDMDGYLAAPIAADPLRYADCCLISDGAVAFVMTTHERAVDAPHKPVFVKGIGFGADAMTGDDAFTQRPDQLELHGVERARRQLEADAGIDVTAVDFAEIYDCFTISCLLQLEDLGFCKKGEAGRFAADGHITHGGSLPVNTHGGLLSYSYRLAGEHVIEAVRQLRGDAGANQVVDAELGLVTGLSTPDYAALMLGA